jgi:uncharacterized protein YkwD
MDQKVRTGIIAGLCVLAMGAVPIIALIVITSKKDQPALASKPQPSNRARPETSPTGPLAGIQQPEPESTRRAIEDAPEEKAAPEGRPARPSLGGSLPAVGKHRQVEEKYESDPPTDVRPVRPALLEEDLPGGVAPPATKPTALPTEPSPRENPPLHRAPATVDTNLTDEEQVVVENLGNLSQVEQVFLNRLNIFRSLAGQTPARVDPALSEGCMSHANYLALHDGESTTAGLGVHAEKAGLAGYAPKGDAAARRSVITQLGSSRPTLPQRGWPVTALDFWASTLYHRVPMLSPNLKRVGIGYASNKTLTAWYVVMDVGADPQPPSGKRRQPLKPVVYPADGQTDIPRLFSWGVPELPNPLPAGSTPENSGYPITVSFPRGRRVTAVTALLRRLQEKEGAETLSEIVPVWLSTPETPASSADQQNTICLIARTRLKDKTTYEALVQASVDGEKWQKIWKFTTGKTKK